MSGVGRALPDPDASSARRKRAGAWVSYLIFALMLLLLMVFDAQAAYEQQWAHFASYMVFTVIFLVVPTGGLKWIRRRLSIRKSG